LSHTQKYILAKFQHSIHCSRNIFDSTLLNCCTLWITSGTVTCWARRNVQRPGRDFLHRRYTVLIWHGTAS